MSNQQNEAKIRAVMDMGIENATREVIIEALMKFQWNSDAAVEHLFMNPPPVVQQMVQQQQQAPTGVD